MKLDVYNLPVPEQEDSFYKALHEHKGYRAASRALNLSKTVFVKNLRDELNLCRRPACLSPRKTDRTLCEEHMSAASKPTKRRLEYSKEYKAKNKESLTAYNAQWRKDNAEKMKAYAVKHRLETNATQKLYLTEDRLHEVLIDLFGEVVVSRQRYLHGRTRDFVIVKQVSEKIESMLSGSFSGFEEPLPVVTLIVEFDGPHHYLTTSSVIRDGQHEVKWQMIDSLTFILRIPYWVQLDSMMTEYLFGSKTDYSNNFPHGFIDPKAPLPERFCSEGELRFLREIKSLPERVAAEVYKSLAERIKRKALSAVCSLTVLESLVNLCDADRRLFLQELRTLSPDPNKYYKYLTPAQCRKLLSDIIIKSLFFQNYAGGLTSFEIEEQVKHLYKS